MSATTYDQCVDQCERTHREGVAFDLCLDGCDERFAAGKEPPMPTDWGITIEVTE